MSKTPQEIQDLKEGWLKDPCWGIEDTEGFSDHYEELLSFRKQKEAEWENKRKERKQRRHELVMEQTGVVDPHITSAINTFDEIERQVSLQDRYIGEYCGGADIIKVELMQSQIRATLLQAAQLKRIADALENMDDGNNLVMSTNIWGSK